MWILAGLFASWSNLMFYFLETSLIILEGHKLQYEDSYIEKVIEWSQFWSGRQRNYLILLADFLHLRKEKYSLAASAAHLVVI